MSAFIASLHISTLLHLQNCRLNPAWPSQLGVIQFLPLCVCMCMCLWKRSGISNSFKVWLCCIRFMRSTHEQTVGYQNKCSRSGCVSWDFCTEISLMIISLGKHVNVSEALFSSVSVFSLFLLKFQYLVNGFILIAVSPASAVCGALRLRVSAGAISASRLPMRGFVRCLAPELCSVGCRASFSTVCSTR